jgi:hypothetical protein
MESDEIRGAGTNKRKSLSPNPSEDGHVSRKTPQLDIGNASTETKGAHSLTGSQDKPSKPRDANGCEVDPQHDSIANESKDETGNHKLSSNAVDEQGAQMSGLDGMRGLKPALPKDIPKVAELSLNSRQMQSAGEDGSTQAAEKRMMASSALDQSTAAFPLNNPSGSLTASTNLAAEEAGSSSDDNSIGVRIAVILKPRETDVLFGRGRSHRDNPGNKRMQLTVDVHRDAYDNADRDKKTEITKAIVKIIKSQGNRFLKFDKREKVWHEVSDEMSRRKVGHAMRDGWNRPLGQIDPKLFEGIPFISDDVRKTLDQMASFNQRDAQATFGAEEAAILNGLLTSSSTSSPVEESAGGNGKDTKPAANESNTDLSRK